MKKHITLIILALAATVSANAQFKISYSAGYGDYAMGDMSKLLNMSLGSISDQLPAGVKITDNFPGYVTHNLDATYQLNRHEFGLKGTYMTTGGKIAYADYSGKYHEQLTLNGFRIGALYRFHFANTHIGNLPLSFFGELSPAITFTKLKYDALLSLPDYDINEVNPTDEVGTKETGYSIQPMIGAQLSITRNIFAIVSAGYDVEFGAKLSTTNNLYRADWSGIRLNAGVGVSF